MPVRTALQIRAGCRDPVARCLARRFCLSHTLHNWEGGDWLLHRTRQYWLGIRCRGVFDGTAGMGLLVVADRLLRCRVHARLGYAPAYRRAQALRRAWGRTTEEERSC